MTLLKSLYIHVGFKTSNHPLQQMWLISIEIRKNMYLEKYRKLYIT